jgi:hypothetical protein
MEIAFEKVFEILKEKDVHTIFHANSVITSCQFLRKGALLSRGDIDRKKLYQTPQKSDALDKIYSIWFDVFTDSVDIHERANRANLYGPVLFVLDTDSIRNSYTGNVWVTKLNPTKWNGKSHEQRWFTSPEDLRENFVRGRFDQMIVFRHCGGELYLRECLKEIVLDDPQLINEKIDINYYSMAYGALVLAMTEGNFNINIIKRRMCQNYCLCTNDYRSNYEKSRDMYLPTILQ